MTRIIAGAYGGRRIQTPKGDGTRPTSDRVREAMFSTLESELGGFDEVAVLDVFAGSGALGLEALSRGAVSAVFVESDARAASVIKANVRSLGAESATVVRGTAAGFLGRPHHDPVQLVFLDPPYALPTDQLAGLVRRASEVLGGAPLFVVERSTRDRFAWPEGVEPLKDKAYGETHLWYGR